jgi:hypothetical protein
MVLARAALCHWQHFGILGHSAHRCVLIHPWPLPDKLIALPDEVIE